MSVETTSTLSNVAKTAYNRILLERLEPAYVHGQFADPSRNIVIEPGRKTVEWRRYSALSAATTPLTEGTVPAGNNNTVTLVTATPAQYGDFVSHSDVLELVDIDPFLATQAGIFGQQAGETLDQICRDILAAGTTVQYAGAVGGRTSVAATNKLSADEIRIAVRTLRNANAPRFPDSMGGSYAAIVHGSAVYDLMLDPDWQAASLYSGAMDIKNGLLGRFLGVSFYESSAAKVFAAGGANSIDVYATLVFGQHWYGKAKWAATGGFGASSMSANDGSMVEFFVKQIGTAGSADPLNQLGSVGWKVSHVSKILNQSCGVRIEHAVS
jgi:N4-gp56 family major capsid protein